MYVLNTAAATSVSVAHCAACATAQASLIQIHIPIAFLTHLLWTQVDVIDAELLKPWERKRQEYKQRKKVSVHVHYPGSVKRCVVSTC